jgi:hypothetical protein
MPQNGITPRDDDMDDDLNDDLFVLEDPDAEDDAQPHYRDDFLDDLDVVLSDEMP